ncbi:MAG: hypothetical protein J3R72DRAFT_434571 [Linnemannia gamsii]|nr:MAG: hypothetical protein J3R72DRAFT_434571 [Linnemannia gamsii]
MKNERGGALCGSRDTFLVYSFILFLFSSLGVFLRVDGGIFCFSFLLMFKYVPYFFHLFCLCPRSNKGKKK